MSNIRFANVFVAKSMHGVKVATMAQLRLLLHRGTRGPRQLATRKVIAGDLQCAHSQLQRSGRLPQASHLVLRLQRLEHDVLRCQPPQPTGCDAPLRAVRWCAPSCCAVRSSRAARLYLSGGNGSPADAVHVPRERCSRPLCRRQKRQGQLDALSPAQGRCLANEWLSTDAAGLDSAVHVNVPHHGRASRRGQRLRRGRTGAQKR